MESLVALHDRRPAQDRRAGPRPCATSPSSSTTRRAFVNANTARRAARAAAMTARPSLQEIASCVSGYDPKALPVAQAQEFIARLVPRVQAVEKVALRSRARPRPRRGRRLGDRRAVARQLGDGRLCLARQRARATDARSRVQGRRRGLRRAAAFEGAVGARECVRIMTGAVMPAGLDTVVPQEFVRVDGDVVRVPAGVVRRGDNRRLAGEDLARGEVALARRSRPAPGRPRPARLARQRRGAGLPAPARRLLLDRQRAALDRRAARRRLRLRQQPLHAVGDAAAARRRGARPRRRPRRSGRARRRVPRRRRRAPTR